MGACAGACTGTDDAGGDAQYSDGEQDDLATTVESVLDRIHDETWDEEVRWFPRHTGVGVASESLNVCHIRLTFYLRS